MAIEFKVVCIDAKDKPFNVDLKDWVIEGETYTVTGVLQHPLQGMYGYLLKEAGFPEDSDFESYISRRFRPVDEQDIEAEEAVRKLLEEVEELTLEEA